MENFPEGKFLTTVKIGTGYVFAEYRRFITFNGGQRTRYRLAAVFLYGNVVECC